MFDDYETDDEYSDDFEYLESSVGELVKIALWSAVVATIVIGLALLSLS